MSRPVIAPQEVRDAWKAYKATPEFVSTRYWAKYDYHLDGSLAEAFLARYEAARAHGLVRESTDTCGKPVAGDQPEQDDV